MQVGREIHLAQEQIPGPAPEGGAAVTVWIDVATVEVAARVKRRSVIEKALADARAKPSKKGEVLEVRALDADSARVAPVEWEQPPPRLKIG